MRDLPLAGTMRLIRIVGGVLSDKCKDASVDTLFDYRMKQDDRSYCKLSRAYSFECPNKSDIEVLVKHGDGTSGLYKKCTRE